jgi:hypothetical protein
VTSASQVSTSAVPDSAPTPNTVPTIAATGMAAHQRLVSRASHGNRSAAGAATLAPWAAQVTPYESANGSVSAP